MAGKVGHIRHIKGVLSRPVDPVDTSHRNVRVTCLEFEEPKKSRAEAIKRLHIKVKALEQDGSDAATLREFNDLDVQNQVISPHTPFTDLISRDSGVGDSKTYCRYT